MLQYIPFYLQIWSNKKFKSLPNSDCRILYLYLIGNPALTLTGIYNIDIDDCRLKTRLNDKFDASFDEVSSGKYGINFDKENEIIWIKSRFERIPNNKSGKIIVGVMDELNTIKHPFREEFIKLYHEEIKPYLWRIKGYKLTHEEIQSEDFIINAARIYPDKRSLKGFILNKGISEQRIDEIIAKVLPQWRNE